MTTRSLVAILGFAVALSACEKPKLTPPPVSPVPPPAAESVAPPPVQPPPPVAPPPASTADELSARKVQAPQDVSDDMIAKAQQPASTRPDASETGVLAKMVTFEFDSYEIGEAGRAVLQDIAAYLRKDPSLKVTVEGHCDERGTREYNLALGMRRADAVRKYLIDLGIDESRVAAISYGKDRPLDPASGETAWARNRRAQFVRQR